MLQVLLQGESLFDLSASICLKLLIVDNIIYFKHIEAHAQAYSCFKYYQICNKIATNLVTLCFPT
jgi:hypothetical protein